MKDFLRFQSWIEKGGAPGINLVFCSSTWTILVWLVTIGWNLPRNMESRICWEHSRLLARVVSLCGKSPLSDAAALMPRLIVGRNRSSPRDRPFGSTRFIHVMTRRHKWWRRSLAVLSPSRTPSSSSASRMVYARFRFCSPSIPITRRADMRSRLFNVLRSQFYWSKRHVSC